jgi:acyl carrier protein
VDAEIRPDAPDGVRSADRPVGTPAPPADPNDIEGRLRVMWSDLLGVTAIGPDDNFFDIGGHSLLAVRLLTRIEKAFGRAIPLATLFGGGTINTLAGLIRGTGPSSVSDNGSDDEPLLKAVSRDALRVKRSDLDSTP